MHVFIKADTMIRFEFVVNRGHHQERMSTTVPAEAVAHEASMSDVITHHVMNMLTDPELQYVLDRSMEDEAPPLPTCTRAHLERLAPAVSATKRHIGGSCSICCEPFKLRRRVRRLPCGHQFCSRCIQRWVCQHNACCPVCREELQGPSLA